MDLVAAARDSQSQGGYKVDTWLCVTLQPMTKVWQGHGGYSEFFLSEHDAREARGAYAGSSAYAFAETLWRAAQVQPSATMGFRDVIVEFVIDLPTPAACGVCLANTSLGSGTLFQYFIPKWKETQTLYPTGRQYKFNKKSY